MAEHDDELGFFFCENCGHVHKENVPYEKLAEECSHCHFDTWIWEPNEDGDATFTLQCSCSRKIEGIVGGALAADVLHCDCGKTWFVSSGTAVEETEYTHTRVDRLAALEQVAVTSKMYLRNPSHRNYDELQLALDALERMEVRRNENPRVLFGTAQREFQQSQRTGRS